MFGDWLDSDIRSAKTKIPISYIPYNNSKKEEAPLEGEVSDGFGDALIFRFVSTRVVLVIE